MRTDLTANDRYHHKETLRKKRKTTTTTTTTTSFVRLLDEIRSGAGKERERVAIR
jgi:hypothetical protein